MEENGTALPPLTFDLLSQPWITCVATDGVETDVSMIEFFTKLEQIDRIAGESPQQDYAMWRFLFAIFWRSAVHAQRLGDSSREWSAWWVDAWNGVNQRETIGDVLSYLDVYRDRFDLFDPVKPFMQVAGLRTAKDEHSSVRRLIPDSESSYFTMRAGPGAESLSFAEAGRWLVAIHAWDYSGIKSGAVGDPRVKGGKGYPIGTGWAGKTGGTLLRGSNAWETLVLNTPPELIRNQSDLPWWEREPYGPGARGGERPDGPADLLTWQSRRVRLFSEDGNRVTGALVANGDKIALANNLVDPMTSYRYSPNQSKGGNDTFFPRTWDHELSVWRGAEAVIAGDVPAPPSRKSKPGKPVPTLKWLHEIEDDEGDLGRRIAIDLVGFSYGVQDSVIENAVSDTIPIHVDLVMSGSEQVGQLITEAVEATLESAIVYGRFIGNLKADAGADYEFNVAAKETLLHDIENSFLTWIGSVRRGHEAEARDVWFAHVENLIVKRARADMRSASPRAIIGRIDKEGYIHSAAVSFRVLRSQLRKILQRSHPESVATQEEGGNVDQ